MMKRSWNISMNGSKAMSRVSSDIVEKAASDDVSVTESNIWVAHVAASGLTKTWQAFKRKRKRISKRLHLTSISKIFPGSRQRRRRCR